MLPCRPACPKNWPLNSDRSKNYDRPGYLPCRNEKRLSSTELHQSIKRFYQLLAWGTSFLMTVLVAIMEAISPPYTWLKPNLGLHSCWFDGQYAEVIYFYGPIGRFVGMGEAHCYRMVVNFRSRRNKYWSLNSLQILLIFLKPKPQILWIFEYFSNKNGQNCDF